MKLKRSLKGLLAGLLVGAGALTSHESLGEQLEFRSNAQTGISGSITYLFHESGAQEMGPDGYDGPWSGAPPSPNNQQLRALTDPYSEALKTDSRPLGSETKFQSKLCAIDKLGGNVTSTNTLKFTFLDSADSTRHYIAKIHCDTNYTPNHVAFDKSVNIRDVISAGGYVGLPGIVSCPSGTVYGTVDVNPQFNRLVSSKSGNGSNSFEGNTGPINYQTNMMVNLNADSGNYIDYYVLTRTDNTGTVSVVTNDFVGNNVTSTNVSINGIIGSNAIHAVYAPAGFTVNIENGAKYGLNPTNFTGVANGGSVTTTAANVYSTNAPGIRTKIVGLEKKLP